MALHISYRRPLFHRRCFACLVDFFLFALVFGALFIGARAIVTSTPDYRAMDAEYTSIRYDSALYRHNNETHRDMDLVSYLNESGFSGYAKWSLSREAIDKYIVYLGDHGASGSQQRVQARYDEHRLTFVYEGVKAFTKDEAGVIDETAEFKEKATLVQRYENVYAPFIDGYLQASLVVDVPRYNEINHYQSNMLFFAEIIPSYALAGILVYYLPTLFFRRGRMTLGKAMYRIATVNSSYLVPSWQRSLARFAIFYFGELLLAPFTFAIPFLVSFSLMAFTKNKQGFPDFMLKLHEVDVSDTKVYFSKAEIRVDEIPGHRKPVDFAMEKPE